MTATHQEASRGAITYYSSNSTNFTGDSTAYFLGELERRLKWFGRHEVYTVNGPQDPDYAINEGITHYSHSYQTTLCQELNSEHKE